jgi:hypothetical protein
LTSFDSFRGVFGQSRLRVSASFSLVYEGSQDWGLHELSAQISATQPGANVLSVTLAATLTDGTHQIAPASWVEPVCVAVTGTTDPGTVLANPPSTQSPWVKNPEGGTAAPSEPWLSGFTMTYPQTGNMDTVSATSSLADAGDGAYDLVQNAQMFDHDGHIAECEVDAGIYLTADNKPGLLLAQQTANLGQPLYVDMGVEVSQAVVMITGFVATYSSTHNFQGIWVSSMGSADGDTENNIYISGSTVTLPGPAVHMWDMNHAHTQDTPNCSLTVAVLAVPAES